MKKMWGQIQAILKAIPQKAKVRIGIAVAAVIILQLYFVRELMAAELLFALAVCFSPGAWVPFRTWPERSASALGF